MRRLQRVERRRRGPLQGGRQQAPKHGSRALERDVQRVAWRLDERQVHRAEEKGRETVRPQPALAQRRLDVGVHRQGP